jgi:hypothetical protein
VRRFTIHRGDEPIGEGVCAAHDVYDGTWIPYAIVYDSGLNGAYFDDTDHMRRYFDLGDDCEIRFLDPEEA